ncbi:MAG TPA: sulfatase-like hydrolase/transferase, partial [Acidimicrobiia bacterium]|nr:sulfatase-like hydrolase/transferase [Acidimicrobiia bacterium]
AVAVLPAAACWVVGIAIGVVWERGRALWHAVAVAGLLALLVALLLDAWLTTDEHFGLVGAGAGLAWMIAIVAYRELDLVASWTRAVGAAAPGVVAIFLFASPVSALVVPDKTAPVERVATNGAPVVLIVLDELPLTALLDGDGGIDATLYPELAALANDATWYRNTTTVHGFSTSAVPAIFSGRYPDRVAPAPTSSNFPETLFTFLGGSYDLHAFEQYDLCGAATCEGDGTDQVARTTELVGDSMRTIWDKLVPDAPPSIAFEHAGRSSVASIEDMIGSIDGSHHSLYATHVFLPHAPFEYTASGTRYEDPDPYFGLVADRELQALRWSGPATATLAEIRHRLQLQFTDALVGRIVDRLRAVGIYDDAVVVVTADHGIAFRSGEPHRVVTDRNANEILWVPLLVKAPNQTRGVVDDTNVETVDILPLIAQLLDAELPWIVDGVAPGARPSDEKHYFSAWDGTERAGGITYDGRDRFRSVVRSGRDARATAPGFAAYATGRHDELLGRAVASMRVGAGAGVVELDGGAHRRITDREPLPLVVQGRLRDADTVRDLAVAVNGRVAAITRSFAVGREAHFAAMVPDWLMRKGDNEVSVYAVTDRSNRPTLMELDIR